MQYKEIKYKAAMFDFDGTITEKGESKPGPEMVEALIQLAEKMPIGFCTGRELASFVHRGFATLVKNIEKEHREKFLKNLFLFAENGAIGYEYNPNKADFEEFYRVVWPENYIKKMDLKLQLGPKIAEFGEICEDAHEIVVVIRTRLYNVEERKVEDVYALSEQIYQVCLDSLRKFDANFEEHLHIGNSGIGVVIGPANGDKDQAIIRFANLLREKRGLSFNKEAREIMVVGDSALVGGNDHYFLSGRYGSPFTVGPHDSSKKFPQPVTDSSGKNLLHARGTLHLINSISLNRA